LVVAANVDVDVAPPREGSQKSSKELNSIDSSKLVVLNSEIPERVQSSANSVVVHTGVKSFRCEKQHGPSAGDPNRVVSHGG
jgi:hypothetical protein